MPAVRPTPTPPVAAFQWDLPLVSVAPGSFSRQRDANRYKSMAIETPTRAQNYPDDILCYDVSIPRYINTGHIHPHLVESQRRERAHASSFLRSAIRKSHSPSAHSLRDPHSATVAPFAVHHYTPSCKRVDTQDCADIHDISPAHPHALPEESQKMANAHVDIFQKLVVGNTTLTVDPNQCIPFSKVREISESGVKRLMNIFRGVEVPGCTFLRFCSSGHLPTVIAMTDELADAPKTYFIDKKGMTVVDAHAEVSKFSQGFGIIDGAHRNEALRRLSVDDPVRFSGFRWTVQLLTTGTLPELQEFARNCNEKQTETFYVQSTLYDTIRSLQEDMVELMKRNNGCKPPTAQLVKFYTGGKMDVGAHMLYTLARISIAISSAVIYHQGTILNEESPVEASKREGAAADRVDCRVYRNLVTSNTFLKSTEWMRAKGPDAERCQVAALYRLKKNAAVNQFKPAPPKFLDSYYMGAVYGSMEIQKFTNILDGMPWPSAMLTLRENLLHKTILDVKLNLNKDNPKTVFPPLMDAFVRCCPNVSHQKMLKWQPGQNSELKTSTDIEPPTCLPESAHRNGSDHCESSTTNQTIAINILPLSSEARDCGADYCDTPDGSSIRTSADASQELRRKVADLESVGVTAVNLEWRVFESEVMKPEASQTFDMVLTDPPNNLQGADITEFVIFAKRVLKPGRSLFIFVDWSRYFDWIPFLREHNFRIMRHPFVFIPDTSQISRTRSTDYPQGAAFFGIACTAHGTHPDKFKVNLSSPYINPLCSHARKFAIMDNCPFPSPPLRRPGSKRPFMLTERSPRILGDILQTFSPPGGQVMDPFAGTLSLGTAAVMSGRKCTLIESSTEIFAVAIDRLSHITALKDTLRSRSSGGDTHQQTARLILDSFIARLPYVPRTESTCDEDSDSDSERAESIDSDCLPSPAKKTRLSYVSSPVRFRKETCVTSSSSQGTSSPRQTGAFSAEPSHLDSFCRVQGCLMEASDA